MAIINIAPLTRIEGHLDVEVEVEDGVVVDAKSSGTMFRGFEAILRGRDPLDAPHYTQRICGVCPVSHGMAACLNLEDAFGLVPPPNGRVLRNLVLGANFLQSHILHFYHLTALDYIDTTGHPVGQMSPWMPQFVTPDMVTGDTAAVLVGHYVEALAMRRKAHQMGALFGGKLPCCPSFVPGGCTEAVTPEKIADFLALLDELRQFIDTVYLPDVLAVAGLFPEYGTIGTGCGNLLAYGVFDLDDAGTDKLLPRGRYTYGTAAGVDPVDITEYVTYSWYAASCGGLNPSQGSTEPQPGKEGAYSWLKAPRYLNEVHELGPLARMRVSGDYPGTGTAVIDRVAARAFETQLVAEAMVGWLDELAPGDPGYEYAETPASASGIGLTEAPRGALGHWIDIEGGAISRYQVITPTNWNASPKDDFDQKGPIEQALIGTPVADLDQPIEILRVVHSFDPCLACSVHMVVPRGEPRTLRVI